MKQTKHANHAFITSSLFNFWPMVRRGHWGLTNSLIPQRRQRIRILFLFQIKAIKFNLSAHSMATITCSISLRIWTFSGKMETSKKSGKATCFSKSVSNHIPIIEIQFLPLFGRIISYCNYGSNFTGHYQSTRESFCKKAAIFEVELLQNLVTISEIVYGYKTKTTMCCTGSFR